jgi:hypothetical protein
VSCPNYTRTRFEAQLRDSCVVEVPGVPTSDGKGGRIPGAPSEVAYACTLRPNNGSTRVQQQDREQVRGSYTLRLPTSAVISEGWFVRALGQRFKVVWAPPASSDALTRKIGVDQV